MARTVETVIQFPYKRSLGPVFGEFMTALTHRRILGVPWGDKVLCPPLEWDPYTAEELTGDLVEVGPAGTVTNWTWVGVPTAQHPLDHPFAFAHIRLDGADTPMFHAVDCGSPESIEVGARVAPRWRAARVGSITDIECFVIGEEPVTPEADGGGAAEPVTLMDYHVAITYNNPVPANAERSVEAAGRQVLLGQRCPECGRVYSGIVGSCVIDDADMGPDHEVELPQRGTVTNFTIVTPTQYPGQTETEPFSRCMILLEASDVVLSFQLVLDTPPTDIRVGMKVAAVWPSPAERASAGGAGGGLVGWMPTGEPDNSDPDLVNRIM